MSAKRVAKVLLVSVADFVSFSFVEDTVTKMRVTKAKQRYLCWIHNNIDDKGKTKISWIDKNKEDDINDMGKPKIPLRGREPLWCTVSLRVLGRRRIETGKREQKIGKEGSKDWKRDLNQFFYYFSLVHPIVELTTFFVYLEKWQEWIFEGWGWFYF